MKRRIYVDTSVIGGCLDEEFKDGSVALFDAFRAGAATMVVSDITQQELEPAPKPVRGILYSVPPEYREVVPSTDETDRLADTYIREGVVSQKHTADARHIAIATVNRVDALISWDSKHIANDERIRRYNDLNIALGYTALKIHTPDHEVSNHENQCRQIDA